jgi:hypothetical protein
MYAIHPSIVWVEKRLLKSRLLALEASHYREINYEE